MVLKLGIGAGARADIDSTSRCHGRCQQWARGSLAGGTPRLPTPVRSDPGAERETDHLPARRPEGSRSDRPGRNPCCESAVGGALGAKWSAVAGQRAIDHEQV
jgi:hypothetical protein